MHQEWEFNSCSTSLNPRLTPTMICILHKQRNRRILQGASPVRNQLPLSTHPWVPRLHSYSKESEMRYHSNEPVANSDDSLSIEEDFNRVLLDALLPGLDRLWGRSDLQTCFDGVDWMDESLSHCPCNRSSNHMSHLELSQSWRKHTAFELQYLGWRTFRAAFRT